MQLCLVQLTLTWRFFILLSPLLSIHEDQPLRDQEGEGGKGQLSPPHPLLLRIVFWQFSSGFLALQVPVDTPETEKGKEPSDNDANALKQNDIVKHDHDDIDEHENDNTNYKGIVEKPRTALDS